MRKLQNVLTIRFVVLPFQYVDMATSSSTMRPMTDQHFDKQGWQGVALPERGKKPNAANSRKGKLCNYFKSVFDIFSGSSFLISTSSFAVTKSFLKIDT